MSDMDRSKPRLGNDEIEAIARSVEPVDFERIAPPPHVLTSLLAELTEAIAEPGTAAQGDTNLHPLRSVATPSGQSGPPATRRPPTTHRFTSTRFLQLAAALLVLGGLAVVLTRFSNDDTNTRQLATAMMTDDGLQVATTATAQAQVVCDDDGCAVEVDLTALPDAGSDDLELWVINADVTDMYSLGIVTDSGKFALPFGVTADDFPIVDISVEPRDGVPTHSGQSVLRGVFETS